MKVRLFMSEIICDMSQFQQLSFLQMGLLSKTHKNAFQLTCEWLVYVSNITSGVNAAVRASLHVGFCSTASLSLSYPPLTCIICSASCMSMTDQKISSSDTISSTSLLGQHHQIFGNGCCVGSTRIQGWVR